MALLNQIIAVEKGIKSQTQRELSDIYQKIQKNALLSGISRKYTPKDDDGEIFPPESTKVQVFAENEVEQVNKILTRLYDVVLTKDVANCKAFADISVDGVSLMSVPVTYLLFLEKQLVDVHTFVQTLPVLDPSEEWDWDIATDCWATEPAQTVKTKKIPRNHVKAEATAQHPAQVEVYTEDVVVGYWKTIKYSGAMTQERVGEILERLQKLTDAVKFAREKANSIEIDQQHIGKALFSYLFDS